MQGQSQMDVARNPSPALTLLSGSSPPENMFLWKRVLINNKQTAGLSELKDTQVTMAMYTNQVKKQ